MGYSQKFLDEKPTVFPKAKRSLTFSQVRQKFWKDSGEITTAHIQETYDRNGLAHAVIDLLSDKCFNKGWKPDTSDDKIEEEIEVLNKDKKIRFEAREKEAFRWSRVHGFSLILYSYVDSGETLAEPVKNPRLITETSVVSRPNVCRFIYEDETNKSGAITGVELNGGTVGLSSNIIIHASRFDIVGDTQSRGILIPAWNWLELFDNNTWSFGQSMFRYGSGFPFMKITDADADEVADAQAMWETVTARTGFVGDERTDISFVGAAGKALDFKSANDVGLQLVAIAMGFPYALLVGAHAGTIAGSETNSAELYDRIEALQKNEIECYIWDGLQRFYEVGMLSDIDWPIKWEPLWMLSATEIADIELKQAQADQIYANLGYVSGDEIRRKRDFKVIQPDPDFDIPDGKGSEYKALPPPQPFGAGGFGSQQDPQAQRTSSEATPGSSSMVTTPKPPKDPAVPGGDADEKESKLQDNAAVESAVDAAIREISNLYDYDSMRQAIDALSTIDSAKVGDDNQSELLTKINLIIDSNQARARLAVDKITGRAYNLGHQDANGELGVEIPISARAAASIGGLKNGLFEVIAGLNADVKRDLRNALLDQLQRTNGSNLAEVRDALRQVLQDLEQNLPEARIATIARTESNRAFNQANFNTYVDGGVSYIQVITARDERVRDEHAAVDGEIRPIGESFSNGYTEPPFGPNCRCSIIPIITNPQEAAQ